jgi:hypothetical protein
MISFKKARAGRTAIDPDDPCGPVSDDFALAADFAADVLSAEQERAVEERLVEDEEFFKMVLPLVQLRHTRVSLAKELGFVPPPLPVKAKTDKARWRIRPVWLKERHLWAAGLAATTITAALPALPLVERAVGIAGQHDVYSGDVTAVAKARDFDLPDGAAVHLAQGGAMSYDARITPHHLVVWLEGSATIDIPRGQESIMVIRTSGYVTLTSNGSYAVNAPENDPAIRVTVLAGRALMRPFGTRQASLTLQAGQQGEMDNASHFTGLLHDGGRGASMNVDSSHVALQTGREPADRPAPSVGE